VYEISDNRNSYLAEITTARRSLVVFEVAAPLPTPVESAPLYLVAALFKFDRFEWMLEKATELGATQILPFKAKRTEKGLAEAARKRAARWERIILEASQQSRRVRMPEIFPAAAFPDRLLLDCEVRLLLDEEEAPPIGAVLAAHSPLKTPSVAVLLGPEGGWIDEERAEAVEHGWQACSLGPTILRAETAGLAGLAIARAWQLSR
jgi:16S rRNA (uracil1498-N3)-methyltransferase